MHSSKSHHLTRSFPSAPEPKRGSHVNRARSEAMLETGSAPCVSLSLHAAHTRGFPNGARTTMHSTHAARQPSASAMPPPCSVAASHTPRCPTMRSQSRRAPTTTPRAAPVRWQLRESPFVIPVSVKVLVIARIAAPHAALAKYTHHHCCLGIALQLLSTLDRVQSTHGCSTFIRPYQRDGMG